MGYQHYEAHHTKPNFEIPPLNSFRSVFANWKKDRRSGYGGRGGGGRERSVGVVM